MSKSVSDVYSVPEAKHPPQDDAIARTETLDIGHIDKLDDKDNREFYGNSLTDRYRLKSELVAKCMEEIGMGRFQWELFVVTGFGWITDNFWSQGIGAVQPAVVLELQGIEHVALSSVAYYVGMIIGASFWGISCDFIGRNPAFNTTVFMGGIFACACAGLTNFGAFCFFWFIIGTAAGGNVPVDSIIFLEYIPGSHQYLLTALSAWWNFAQVIVSLIAWVFLANFSCPSDSDWRTCKRADNMGWRYTLIALGGLAIAFGLIRILVFHLPESPRYLLSRGRDEEAVEAINYVARRNGRPDPISLTMLQEIDAQLGVAPNVAGEVAGLTRLQILRDNVKDFKLINYKDLFATKSLIRHTTLIWSIWLIIGIAYPLYFNFLPTYLAQKFTSNNSLSATYRSYCITSAVGVVGPITAAFLVNSRLGSRWSMGISAIVTGIFLFAYTVAKTSDANLAFSSVTGLLGNLFYAIMYAFTPESFPAPYRGLGTGQAATLLRFGGLIAALIGVYTNFTVVPIYVSAAMWIGVGCLAFGLPFETHGRAAI